MKKIIAFLVLIILFMPYNVKALEGTDIIYNDTKQIQQLYDYIYNMKTEYEISKDMNIKDYVKQYMKTGNSGFSVKKILSAILNFSFREATSSMKLMSMIIIISVVCALLNNLEKAFSNENLSSIAYLACFSVIILLMAKSFYTGVGVAKTTINNMTDFMTALMPVLMTLLASVGGFTEAAIMDPLILGTITLVSRFYVNFIIPLIFMTFVLKFVSSISTEYKVDKLIKLLNQIAIWFQGIVMTLFIGIVTARSITSKTIDQVAAKTAKYAVDNFIPIVGKCLSDAISTVAGYSVLLKNALSSVGLIVILIIVIFPIIKILVMAFMYKLVAALIEPISDIRLVNCINSAGDSLILVMSCLISVSVMFFVMISIIATAGKMVIGG